MINSVEVLVPEMGDFKAVDVVEVLVANGDTVSIGDALVIVETDKASMDIAATVSGVVAGMEVTVGSQVKQGQRVCAIVVTEASAAPVSATPVAKPEAPAPAAQAEATPAAAPANGYDFQLLVLGSGPGGYTAAFRGADLGLKTAMVEHDASLGGVCLNVGCIPSKALLHAAKVLDEAAHFADQGISFGKPEIDLDKLRGWKDSVVNRLTGGIGSLAKSRKVEVLRGTGMFTGPHSMEIDGPDGKKTVTFEFAVIAAGSEPARVPGFPYEDPRLMDSTGALALVDIPKRLLVIGGGIIGLEMSCVYEALGSKVTVVEMMDRLIPGADKDLVRPLQKRITKRYENIYLSTMVKGITSTDAGLKVTFEGKDAPAEDTFDRVLLSVGRRPNGKKIGAEAAGVVVDERGFIAVNNQQRTNVPHIFGIGDIVGNPMLAHKATHEGKVAAEVASGMATAFVATVIPSVAYTDPEIAWVGVTEEEAKAKGIKYGKGVFPWAASGRSLALGRDDGMTKMLFDEETERVIGAGAVGPGAGELIAEAGLAIEMGCDAADIGLTIHAHPTLSETMGFAAEAFEGTITDLYIPKKKK